MSKEQNRAQFIRAFISKQDFEEAKKYLLSYKSELDDVIKRALLVAAVVSYSKPFTTNNGGNYRQSTPTLKVNANTILNKNKEITFHKKILDLRKKAVAHSDFGKRPTNLIQASENGYLVGYKKFDLLSEILNYDIELFLSITAKMIKYCDDTMSRLKHQV